jgi:hypothetical protein
LRAINSAGGGEGEREGLVPCAPGAAMLDAVLIVAGVAFFALAVLYGIACDHL